MEDKKSSFMEGGSFHGFYKKTYDERLKMVEDFCHRGGGSGDFSLLRRFSLFDMEGETLFDSTNRMIENVISVIPVPLGVATHFLINGKDYLIPMATEEASVVAAASYAAKLARPSGGFFVDTTPPIMIGQIQLKKIPDVRKAIGAIEKNKSELLKKANSLDPVLIRAGGGALDITLRPIETRRGPMLILHLLVDVRDAMGANIVNVMAEKISGDLKILTGGSVGIRIVSNLSLDRMVCVRAVWKKELLLSTFGEDVIEEFLDAYEFACSDPFRCATFNKGIMNGVDAVALATGNDFRAIEAGAHAYAAIDGYKPLSSYYKNEEGDLVGELKIPVAVGIVGGITQCHPVAKIGLKILGVDSASELAAVIGAVGLAQNFAAQRALVCEGISKGHMRLHSKNIAMAAGASRGQVDLISEQMIEEDNISVGRAKELLEQLS